MTMAAPGGLLGDIPRLTYTLDTALILAGVHRAVSHTETLAAATATLTSKRTVKITPETSKTAEEYVLVTRISTVGIQARNLIITARDLNRANFRMQLPPELEIADVPLVGDQSEGVQLTFENFNRATVGVTIHIATLSRAAFLSIFGLLSNIQREAAR